MNVRNKSRGSVLLLVVVLAVSLAAVAAQADSDAPSAASVRHRVVAIVVEGNSAVSEDEILEALAVEVGDMISENEARERASAVLEIGKLSNAVPRLEPASGGRKLVLTVHEYPKIKGYEFSGNTVLSDEQLASMVSLKPGEVLDTKVLDSDLAAILAAYEEEGYSAELAGVSLTSDARVSVELVEHRLGKVIIEGNSKTKLEVIERELELVSGELVNFGRIREGVTRVFKLGIFSEVLPSLEPASEKGVLDLRLKLTEAKTGSFAAGVGYNSADGFLGYLEAADNNFLGMNYKVAASLEVGKDTQNYSLSFANPWLDDRRTSLQVALYSRNGHRDGFVESRRGGDLAVGRPLTDTTRADVTLKVEEVHNTWTGQAPPGVTAGGATRSVGLRVLNDTRDSAMDPRTGGTLKGSTEFAGGILGGDYDFSKYEFQATRFVDVKDNQTIGLRLGYGTSVGQVPIHEQYEVGGSETVRGYRYREFMGTGMIYGNVEYRYRINDTVQAVAFADIGDAWTDGKLIKLSDLKTGLGVGVRIMTPIGVIRLDYGMGREGGHTYFSLGQTF
ncbi:MAG: BamA/TamA family outer membrane protein [Firmicutes bacterium]|nr:BamA/TamA family outer membrane protein [Bacillota bacterium]